MKRAADPELAVMRRMMDTLRAFDENAQNRILGFLCARVQAGLRPEAPPPPSPPGPLLAAMQNGEAPAETPPT
jgi:hypothetical protein